MNVPSTSARQGFPFLLAQCDPSPLYCADRRLARCGLRSRTYCTRSGSAGGALFCARFFSSNVGQSQGTVPISRKRYCARWHDVRIFYLYQYLYLFLSQKMKNAFADADIADTADITANEPALLCRLYAHLRRRRHFLFHRPIDKKSSTTPPRINVLRDFKIPKPSGDQSAKLLYEANCEKNLIRLMSGIYLKKKMGTGKVSGMINSNGWINPQSRPVLEKIHAALCGTP